MSNNSVTKDTGDEDEKIVIDLHRKRPLYGEIRLKFKNGELQPKVEIREWKQVKPDRPN